MFTSSMPTIVNAQIMQHFAINYSHTWCIYCYTLNIYEPSQTLATSSPVHGLRSLSKPNYVPTRAPTSYIKGVSIGGLI